MQLADLNTASGTLWGSCHILATRRRHDTYHTTLKATFTASVLILITCDRRNRALPDLVAFPVYWRQVPAFSTFSAALQCIHLVRRGQSPLRESHPGKFRFDCAMRHYSSQMRAPKDTAREPQ